MRENRPYGSEGGEEHSFPTPIHPTVTERYSFTAPVMAET